MTQLVFHTAQLDMKKVPLPCSQPILSHYRHEQNSSFTILKDRWHSIYQNMCGILDSHHNMLWFPNISNDFPLLVDCEYVGSCLTMLDPLAQAMMGPGWDPPGVVSRKIAEILTQKWRARPSFWLLMSLALSTVDYQLNSLFFCRFYR